MSKKLNYKDVDFEKIFSRYVHYGHLIVDLIEYGFEALDEFYNEVFRIQDAVLTELVDKPEKFENMKKRLITYLGLLIKIVDDSNVEEIKANFEKIHDPEYWRELKKMFGKDKQTYFT